MNASEYPPDESYESPAYEEPAIYEPPPVEPPPPPPPPPVEPPPPHPPVEEPPVVEEPPPPPPVEPPPPPPVEPPPVVDEAPEPPPVEQSGPAPPPPVEEPGPSVEDLEPPPPPPVPGSPPDLPADYDDTQAAADSPVQQGDASDVMRPGQPGADELTEEPDLDTAPVEPEWATDGQSPFPVSERDAPLSALVGPGHPFKVSFDGDQGETRYCAMCCAQTVISEVTGRPVGSDEIVARAADYGSLMFDESGSVRGTPVDSLSELLETYGIESRRTTGEADAFERLEQSLASDRRVVLPLDQPGSEGGDDVSVAITGIDQSRGVVLAADSGEGSSFEIPVDLFEESWRDSDFAMTSIDDGPFDVLGMTMHPSFGPSTSAPPLEALPEDGEAALGDWWASSGDPAGCCQTPDEPADVPLEFTDQSGSVHQLPGIDTSGTGQADTARLDANRDGQTDTWIFDTTGSGQADLLYYDSTGSGQPDSVSCCADDGQWTDPIPLTAALNYAPAGQELGTPVAVPQSAVPQEVVDAYPQLLIMPDVANDGGVTLNIVNEGLPGLEQPREGAVTLLLGAEEGLENEANPFVLLPSMVMAPQAEQANVLAAEFGSHWAGPNPFGVDLMNSVLNPGPSSASGNIPLVRDAFQSAILSESRMGSAMLTPTGMEMRGNPLTGTNVTVARTNWAP